MTDKSTDKKDDRTIMNEEKEKRTKKEEKLLEDELVSTFTVICNLMTYLCRAKKTSN